jgi:uncharacterized protein DUF5681
MPDVDLIGTGETGGRADGRRGGRDGRGRFQQGSSGNPAGRPRGIPNPARRAALLLDAEAEALARKAVELALAGDPAVLRLCLDRVLGPRRGRPVAFALPAIANAGDLAAALAAIAAAAAEGALTPDEALTLSRTLAPLLGVFPARDEEARRRRLAAYYASPSGSGAP